MQHLAVLKQDGGLTAHDAARQSQIPKANITSISRTGVAFNPAAVHIADACISNADAQLTHEVVQIGLSLYTTLASSVSGSASRRARQSGPKKRTKKVDVVVLSDRYYRYQWEIKFATHVLL